MLLNLLSAFAVEGKPCHLTGGTFVSVYNFCICGSICDLSVSQPGLNFDRNQSLFAEMKCSGIRI